MDLFMIASPSSRCSCGTQGLMQIARELDLRAALDELGIPLSLVRLVAEYTPANNFEDEINRAWCPKCYLVEHPRCGTSAIVGICS
jgi:hypothetical protein